MKIIFIIRKIFISFKHILYDNSAETELPIELFDRLVKYIASDIRNFFASEQGKTYYKQWLKEHSKDRT